MIKENLDKATVKNHNLRTQFIRADFYLIKVELSEVDLTGCVMYVIDQSER